MKNVLWLSEWFPSVVEPYSGDGIERRAKAASLYNNIVLIHVKKNPNLKFPRVTLEERIYNNNFKAYIYLYPSIRKSSRFFDFILSNFYFILLHFRAIKKFKKEFGKPIGIQVNVAMKCGLIAYIYKWLSGVNYIIVEGIGFYLPESKPAFTDKGWLFRFLAKRVISKASLLITVSNRLGLEMQKFFGQIAFEVIPSVVDNSIFYPASTKIENEVFTFSHVSSLDYPKNFEDILKAFKIVLQDGGKFQLLVHGPKRSQILELVNVLGLEKYVIFLKEAPQQQIAETMRKSQALILYSRYESFGNVIIEANACGIPVLLSDYPTFNEILIEGVTGLKAIGNSPEKLADKIMEMIKNYKAFNQRAIVAITLEKYGFGVIGEKLNSIYDRFF